MGPQVGPRNGSLETTRSERSDAGRVAGSLVPTRADAIERAVMSLFNEKLLREIVAEEVRQVVREEWGRRPGASATCRSQKRVRGQLWRLDDPSLDGPGRARAVPRGARAAGSRGRVGHLDAHAARAVGRGQTTDAGRGGARYLERRRRRII